MRMVSSLACQLSFCEFIALLLMARFDQSAVKRLYLVGAMSG
ncbi:hypothetical protein Goklo_023766 [Gossypium klotzschianum]|uniref:Uncharacterized protein n=1 Tax=Gossypium klotzschianum TaxID=34286 RepID=A0A7J8TRL6_9ROSI|nr:hypothetical protein [Gossypium klotzschianum]